MLSILYVCLCLVSVAAPTVARITKASIDGDSRSSITLSRPFGFAAEGEPFLQFNVSNLEVWAPHTKKADIDYECFRFYLANPLYDSLEVDTPDGGCWPEEATQGLNVIRLVTFNDWITPGSPADDSEADDDVVYTYTESDTRKLVGGLHTLYFVNCCTGQAKVSFDIVTDMYNTVRGEKSYLSIGEIELPTLYLVRSPWQAS